MTEDPDSPFGHDTLNLRAIIIPKGAEDHVSRHDIVGELGPDVVRIPAILVPEGGTRPGCPYVYFGKAVFQPRAGSRRGATVSPAGGSVQADDSLVRPLHHTRYRFAANLSDQLPAGGPPVPALALGQGDPVAAAIRASHALDRWSVCARPSIPADADRYREMVTQPDADGADTSDVDAVAGNDPLNRTITRGSCTKPQDGGGDADLGSKVVAASDLQFAVNAYNIGTDASPGINNVWPAASADDPQGLKMARSAAREAGLKTPEQLQVFHDAITGQGITSYQELLDIATQIKEHGGY